MMKLISPILLCLFLCLCGCARDIDEAGRSSCKYTILMGTNSSPAYDDMHEGDLLGKSNALMVYSEDSFGKIAVYWDERLETEFSFGGIVLTRNSGRLSLKGNLKCELLLYVLERVGQDGWKLREKRKMPPGEIKGFELSLPL